MAKYEDIQVGDNAELTHTITQKDVDKFVDLTGDNNKIHVNEQFAESTSFKKPVAHGMLGASFISTIIGTKLPGDGALWFAQNLEFLLPVRIGDTITVKAEVLKKHDVSHSIELKTEIFNQHRQKVTSGTAKVKVLEQVKPPDITTIATPRRVAVVIGGSGGIGSETCKVLSEEGFAVAIHYLNNERFATQLKKGIVTKDKQAETFRADIADANQVVEMVQQVLRRFERIDVLVNCSTIKVPAIKLSDLQWLDFENHFKINIQASFNLIKAALPIMESQGYGKFINLVTQYVDATPPPLFLPYITAKSALQGFSKALAVELAPKGITVNMVSPGPTETELLSEMPEKAKLLMAAKAPLRRLASPRDVAQVISFLASEKSGYLTGETIRVNGGQVML